VPYRGKETESSYIVSVVEKLSQLYGLSTHEIATVTTANSKAILGFKLDFNLF
jgi:TatD DNase family protein